MKQLLIVLALVASVFLVGCSAKQTPTVEVVVQPGDSIWKIGVNGGYIGDADPRAWVYMAEKMNGISDGAFIYEGQRLYVPDWRPVRTPPPPRSRPAVETPPPPRPRVAPPAPPKAITTPERVKL